jgi:hypothetical protein
MTNLQDLHDYYLSTKPNTLKVQTSSKLLIRLCLHLKLDTPEQITKEYYKNLPGIIDEYYHDDFHKAIQDKSMLAEMIGRYGPKDGWEKSLETLLHDDDSNLRQFSFQSLEFCGEKEPQLILPYIEKYKNSKDELMKVVAARIISKIYTIQNKDLFLKLLENWNNKNNLEFLSFLHKNIQKAVKRNEPFTKEKAHQEYFNKISKILEQLEASIAK